MTPTLSFITANLVARQLGYRMEHGWAQGDEATQAWFSPLGTFATRFGELLREIKATGFTAVDLWSSHLDWRWATLGHLDVAKALLAEHGLAVRTYAAWIPGDAAELRAACRFCVMMEMPVIAGHSEFFARDRAAAVAILREHGIRYAMENHPDTSATQLAARLGDGDPDVAGLALDCGWCATQGWSALDALARSGDRIFCVHLKDVKARRGARTGRELIDAGHETCRLGDGIVPVAAIVARLRTSGFRGPIAIEHEPEEFDPLPDLAASRQRVLDWWSAVEVKESAPPLRVAVIGCGNIARAYGEAMRAHPEIQVLGATDLDSARAQAWAAEHGGRAYASIGDVLADPAVEAVINLTIQQAHVDVVTRALDAGKHVHSEKPLAPTFAEADALVRLAAKRGVRLSGAPVTWLGEAQQTAWKLIRDGRIGTPRVAYATVDWARIESWHPNPAPFYAVGPVFDVGVYPLSLLTAWFGPVARVIAGGGLLLPDRKAKDGKPFTIATEDWIVAVLEFRGGLRARLTADFYVGDPAENRAGLDVHGDTGSVSTAWYSAAAPVRCGPFGGRYQRVWPVRPAAGTGDWWVDWAAGVLELWRGLRTNRPHPTSGAHAAHVVDVMESIHRSMREGRGVDLASTFPPPAPLAWAQ